MFCSSRMVIDARWGYVSREESCDYRSKKDVPLRVKMNPFRYEIGIGRRRPCAIRINKGKRAYVKVSNAIYAAKKRFGLR